MSTIITNVQDQQYRYDKRIHMKGASEIILGCCTSYLNQDGNKEVLTDTLKINLEKIINDYAS